MTMTLTQGNAAEQVELFTSLIWEEEDLIEIRVLPARKSIYVSAGELIKLVPKLYQWNQDGQNIYAGINPRKKKGSGNNENIERFRTFFVDWDGVSFEYIVKAYESAGVCSPTCVIASGHGFHAYWRLDENSVGTKTINDDNWSAYQRGLISVLSSDPRIKDPARIMRLPGFMNCKSDETPPCFIQWYDEEGTYSPESIGIEPLFVNNIVPTNADGTVSIDDEPHPATLYFIANGAPSGRRNHCLFNAACDLVARNYSMDEIRQMLVEPSISSGLQVSEIETTIESAFSRPRTPRVLEDDNIISALEHMAVGTSVAHETAKDSKTKFRGILSNTVLVSDKKDKAGNKKIAVHVSIDEISKVLQKATNEGLKRLKSGVLFSVREDRSTFPESDAVRIISSTEDLFAWSHERLRLHWISGREVVDRDTGDALTPVGRSEFYAHCKNSIEPAYWGIELMPHEPIIDDYLYIHGDLPESDGTALAEISEKLNFATEDDHDLMLAALMTPAWGGPPGARPAFVFMNAMASQIGVGAGKSSTASLMASLWGGYVSIRGEDQWSDVTKRLLSDDGLSKRCVLIDNIKGSLSSAQLESGITATDIDGHRMYHGQARRRNTLVWFLTANSPDLSRDLADRCVLIHVGPPKHASDFAEWADHFVRNRRAALISDVIAKMKGQGECSIDSGNRDRWSLWQRAILSRFKNGNKLCQIIRDRRPEVDADLCQANEIADVIKSMLESAEHDWDKSRVLINKADLYHEIKDQGIGFRSSNSLTRRIHALKGMGDLKYITENRSRSSGRQWLWQGPETTEEEPAFTLKVRASNTELPY